MPQVKPVQPASVSKPASSYSQGLLVETGRLLFTAGQVPEDANGNLVGEGDIKAQARQVFEHIKAIVEEAGGCMGNIVKLTVFLTDMDNFPGFKEIRAEYLQEPYPVGTLVGVKTLVDPKWLIEVEAVAAL